MRDDIFPMVKIISKIGIDDIADCFDAKEMSEVMEAMKPAEDEESEVGNAEKANELLTQQIGIRVVMKLVGLLMKNLGNIKGDLYKFWQEYLEWRNRRLRSSHLEHLHR